MRHLLPGALAALCACAGGGVAPRVSTEPVVFQGEVAVTGIEVVRSSDVTRTELPVPFDSAFAALPGVFTASKFGISELNAKEGRVSARVSGVRGTLLGQRPSTFFSCGETALGRTADRYALSVTGSAAVQPVGEQTALTIQFSATARPDDSGISVNCASNGKLERRMVDSLAARLGVARR